MGWKASLVIINQTVDIPTPKLIRQLGGGRLTARAESTLEDAIYPDDDKLYIGFYKGNTLICDADLPLIFYDEALSEVELNFIGLFPNAEILALNLNSFDNFYGYVLISQGQKIRAKMGDSEVPLRFELGEPLPEEQPLYRNSVLQSAGNRVFRLDDEPYSEDAIGEEFVFEVAKRFLGGRLDSDELDELMFETPFQCYKKG